MYHNALNNKTTSSLKDTLKQGPLKAFLYCLDPRALHIKFEMVDVGIIINGKWQNDTLINNKEFYFILSKRTYSCDSGKLYHFLLEKEAGRKMKKSAALGQPTALHQVKQMNYM